MVRDTVETEMVVARKGRSSRVVETVCLDNMHLDRESRKQKIALGMKFWMVVTGLLIVNFYF